VLGTFVLSFCVKYIYIYKTHTVTNSYLSGVEKYAFTMSCIRHFIYIHCGTDFKVFGEDKACFFNVLCCIILHFDLLSFYQDNSVNS